jgi:hypothetical protein
MMRNEGLAKQLPIYERRIKFTPERIQQIRNLVEQGKSREEIAELIGVAVRSLKVTCSRLAISVRRHDSSHPPPTAGGHRTQMEKTGAKTQERLGKAPKSLSSQGNDACTSAAIGVAVCEDGSASFEARLPLGTIARQAGR